MSVHQTTAARDRSPAHPAPADLAADVGKRADSRLRRSLPASVALHGTLIATSVIALFPILWIAVSALKPGDHWQHPGDFSGLSLDNFSQVLGHTDFLIWFRNSLIISIGTMVLSVFIAATAGYAVSRMRFPGHRGLMWSFLIVQMFPIAVLIVPLYNLMAAFHLLDSYYGLIIAYSTTAVPFCAWMLKGYFDSIPVEIDEAGRVDGLSPFGSFWRLILPLAKPGLAVTAFYSFLTAWAEVAFALTFLQSQGKFTLAVGMRTWVGQYEAQWGLMTAASVLIAIPAAALFLLVQRNLVAGLTAGGTKG